MEADRQPSAMIIRADESRDHCRADALRKPKWADGLALKHIVARHLLGLYQRVSGGALATNPTT